MPGPHDSVVKALFSNTQDAASALSTALPKEIAARVDWTSLEHANLSLVDDELREFHSDIVFTARLDGHNVFLYVLLEHQSTNDTLMAFRMLGYMVLIWGAVVRNKPNIKQLPAILPIVLHHGESEWRAPLELSELIDLPDDLHKLLRSHIPSFRFFLDDLSATDDAALRQRSLTTMMLACLVLLKKSRGSTDLMADLGDWVDVFSQIARAPNGLHALRLLFEYISVTTDASPTNVRQFARLIGPGAEEVYMTAAEKIAQEGLEKGLKIGRKEGQAEMLLRLLTHRFNKLPQDAADRVRLASDEELTRWADRVFTARSLDEVFTE